VVFFIFITNRISYKKYVPLRPRISDVVASVSFIIKLNVYNVFLSS